MAQNLPHPPGSVDILTAIAQAVAQQLTSVIMASHQSGLAPVFTAPAAAPAVPGRRPVGRPPKNPAAQAGAVAAAQPTPAKSKSKVTAAQLKQAQAKAQAVAAKAAAKAAAGGSTTDEPKGRVRVRSAASGQKGPQSYQKRLYWAQFRRDHGKPPHPGDEEFLAAAAAGATAAPAASKSGKGKSGRGKSKDAAVAAETPATPEVLSEVPDEAALEVGTLEESAPVNVDVAGILAEAKAAAAAATAVESDETSAAYNGVPSETAHATVVSARMPL